MDGHATERVHYLELRPAEFQERLGRRPVGYLPLGTLEWHGPHNPLGTDALISHELFTRAARRYGGIVFPPLFVGPDMVRRIGERDLIGMDFFDPHSSPNEPLPGSCYWVPEGLFTSLLEAVLAQAARAGFRCIVADGHGPSRSVWNRMAPCWEPQFNLKLIGVLHGMGEGWAAQMDHAARNETSLMMALRPDLVDLSELGEDRNVWPAGVGGKDPRDASVEFGESCFEQSLRLIGDALARAGV